MCLLQPSMCDVAGRHTVSLGRVLQARLRGQGTEAVCPSGVSYLNVTHLRGRGFVLAQLGLVQS